MTLEDKVIKWLKDNPNPSDDTLHNWAEDTGLNVHDVEAEMYKLATKFVQSKKNESKFDGRMKDILGS